MASPKQDTTAAAPIYPPLFKVVGADNGACHGGEMDFTPYLPTQADDGSWIPGPWIEVDGTIRCCSRGLHLTDVPAGFWIEGARCYRAEIRDGATTDSQLDGGASSKIAVSAARLLESVAWDTVQVFSGGEHVVRSGYCRAGGNATVRARGNATVEVWGNATVRARDNATVQAGDNATVQAGGNATVRARDNATVQAGGDATVISTRYHSGWTAVALSQTAAHVDRRGGTVVCRVAEIGGAP